jgi:hypothetical protein
MTRRQWISFVAMVLVVFAYGVTMTIMADVRISRMQDRIEQTELQQLDLQCRHVLYEDGSTLHGDADRTAECAYTNGG